MSDPSALDILRETQAAYDEGIAGKSDLKWALDNFRRQRFEEVKPTPHNPPVKLK